MKKFLAVYIGTHASGDKSGWNDLDETTRREKQLAGFNAWGEWMATHAASIVETGGPLGKTQRAAADGVSDIKNSLTGYVIVQAESHDAAARMFLNHPHFSIFPGDSVEIMECLPVPAP